MSQRLRWWKVSSMPSRWMLLFSRSFAGGSGWIRERACRVRGSGMEPGSCSSPRLARRSPGSGKRSQTEQCEALRKKMSSSDAGAVGWIRRSTRPGEQTRTGTGSSASSMWYTLRDGRRAPTRSKRTNCCVRWLLTQVWWPSCAATGSAWAPWPRWTLRTTASRSSPAAAVLEVVGVLVPLDTTRTLGSVSTFGSGTTPSGGSGPTEALSTHCSMSSRTTSLAPTTSISGGSLASSAAST
mmetsp:Transcript_1412/g.4333  ORF Transcript_1412/g.4333 Transcript_1412/m.4333 type:complete len:240 (+) Transcript_1412:166-885(+)